MDTLHKEKEISGIRWALSATQRRRLAVPHETAILLFALGPFLVERFGKGFQFRLGSWTIPFLDMDGLRSMLRSIGVPSLLRHRAKLNFFARRSCQCPDESPNVKVRGAPVGKG